LPWEPKFWMYPKELRKNKKNKHTNKFNRLI